MTRLERVKQDIMKVFANSQAKAGHAFDPKEYFHYASTMMSPGEREQDSLAEAMKELVAEGLLEEKRGKHVLTQKGFDQIEAGRKPR